MTIKYWLVVGFSLLYGLELVYSTWSTPISYNKDGNITIGGLFPLHYGSFRKDNYSLLSQPTEVECVRYNFLGFRWMQAMLFAIDEINNRTDLLPNITLGHRIFDTCNTHSLAVTQSISMVEDLKTPGPKRVTAVIGPTSSDKATVTSNILSVYDLPQISYAASSRLLRKKEIYNSFLRTIPNDDEQTEAIVQLLLHHKWTWVGAIAGDDDYGRPGITELKKRAKSVGICIEYTAYVSKNTPEQELKKIAGEIQRFNATVFVMFISAANLQPLAVQLKNLSVNNKTWIASEAWATSDTLRKVDQNLLQGTLGIAIRGGSMPGFRSFLENVSPESQPTNPFLNEFWKETFLCRCLECFGEERHNTNLSYPVCNGMESLESEAARETTYLEWDGVELAQSYSVYLATYVIAHAVDNITRCVDGSGLLENGACPKMESLQPWQLLAYVKQVNFTEPGHNLPFFFDERGDPQASYKLVSWVPYFESSTGEEKIEFLHVGNYSSMLNPSWSIDDSKIFWRNNETETPLSLCSDPCPAGLYRVRLSSDCCYKCLPCPDGEYSIEVDSRICMKCSQDLYSNANKTGCVPKLQEYVRWGDAFGITFICLVALGVSMTVFSAGTFYVKRFTPLVKATNIELSFLLFVSISCCFLTPLFYLVKPQDWSCKARMVSFALSFTVCIAAILVKTLRVLSAFEAKVPVKFNKRSKWLGEHLQVLVVLLITIVQVVFCVIWLLVDPPIMVILPSPRSSMDTLSIECSRGNIGLMVSVYLYISLLAIVSFIFAFRSRKLPENFNEAKFITFSMLIFFIVWLSFIPAYLTTTGYMTTVVNCIAIFASTFGFIACVFFPKLYIIFVTPDRNTVEEMRYNTARHALRSTRGKGSSYLRNSLRSSPISPRVNQHLVDMSLLKGISQNFPSNNNRQKNHKNHSPDTTSTLVRSAGDSTESTKCETKIKREIWRKKYLEKYNSFSDVEEGKVSAISKRIPSITEDSYNEVGVKEKVLTSLDEMKNQPPFINLKLRINVSISPSSRDAESPEKHSVVEDDERTNKNNVPSSSTDDVESTTSIPDKNDISTNNMNVNEKSSSLNT